jgi:hypothetical protein
MWSIHYRFLYLHNLTQPYLLWHHTRCFCSTKPMQHGTIYLVNKCECLEQCNTLNFILKVRALMWSTVVVQVTPHPIDQLNYSQHIPYWRSGLLNMVRCTITTLFSEPPNVHGNLTFTGNSLLEIDEDIFALHVYCCYIGDVAWRWYWWTHDMYYCFHVNSSEVFPLLVQINTILSDHKRTSRIYLVHIHHYAYTIEGDIVTLEGLYSATHDEFMHEAS